jgi:hypothetical protein
MSLTHTLPEKFLFAIGSVLLSVLNFLLIKEYLSLFCIVSLQSYYLVYYILIIIFFKIIDRLFGNLGGINELDILSDKIIIEELKEDYSIDYNKYLPFAFRHRYVRSDELLPIKGSLTGEFGYSSVKSNDSLMDNFKCLFFSINSFRFDKKYNRSHRLVAVPGKYPYPIINYYYYEYFIRLNVYYIFSYSLHTFSQLIVLPPKLCFVTFYFFNLLYQLVPKHGHVEALKLGLLLEHYPFLNYVKPHLELDEFGDLKTGTQHSQYLHSLSERLHYFFFYNLCVNTYYYAFEHVQSILYIFVKYHYTRS